MDTLLYGPATARQMYHMAQYIVARAPLGHRWFNPSRRKKLFAFILTFNND